MGDPARLIPRLDIKGPNVIKGIQFDGYRVVGEPAHLARVYYLEGADELIFQDTVASLYQRNNLLDVVSSVAKDIFIPLTVAGGLRTVDDIREVLRSGADKVGINTGAVENADLIPQAVRLFGSQCIVASIEAHSGEHGRFEVWTDYGRQRTGIDAREWASRVVDWGVGEILLTSIDREGTGRGYQLDLIAEVSELPVPVIACGGARNTEDIVNALTVGKADGVSAASIFHYHYMQPEHAGSVERRYRLRFGKPVDTGNLEFLQTGYGGLRAIPVEPASIPDVKEGLRAAGLSVRTVEEVA